MSGTCQQPGGKSWHALTDNGGDWRTHAHCTPHDARRFTPDHRPSDLELRALAAICHHCPVTTFCARFAADNHLHGFYAGRWIGPDSAPRALQLRPLSLSKEPR